MDFLFGCWSHCRSSIDCRSVVDKMTLFFKQQSVPYKLFPFGPNFAAGIASFTTAKSGLEKDVAETSEFIAVGDVTLYERESTSGNWESTSAAVSHDLRTLAQARHDEARLARLNGDFAAVVYDKGSQKLTMIRDHCGILPLQYSLFGEACAFSSLVRPLLLTPWASHDFDQIALATYLLLCVPGRERTCYRSVKTVLPASRVVVSANASVQSRKYWQPHPAKGLSGLKAGEAYEAVREQLIRAVVSRTNGVEDLSLQLSGGLDSSTIAGIVCSKFPTRNFIAVSGALPIGSSYSRADERDYIEEMKRKYSNLRVHYVTPDSGSPLDGGSHCATWLGSPSPNPFFYLDRKLARRAAELGAKCRISGDGGDFCVSLQDDETALIDLLFSSKTRAFLQQFRRMRRARNLGAARGIRQLVLPGVAPSWIRIAAHRWRRGQWTEGYAIAPLFAKDPDLLRHLRECEFPGLLPYYHKSMRHLEERNLRHLDNYNSSIENIHNATIGMSVRYPLFDHQLLETCIAIPTEFKLSSKLKRMLIREAGKTFLPSKIAQRQDKGWFSPDFDNRMATSAAQFHLELERGKRNKLFLQLVDAHKVQCGLDLLREPQSEKFDPRLVLQVLAPYRLAEFLQTEH